MSNIAFILAGGQGQRLWPLSRENYPKQFVGFINGNSLYQLTLKRLLAEFKSKDIYVVTKRDYKFIVEYQIESLANVNRHIKRNLKENIIFEPASRNTAPAIMFSVKYLEENKRIKDQDVVYVFPSDHVVKDKKAFSASLKESYKAAQCDYMVVFGIVPSAENTEYGYIISGDKILHTKARSVCQFIEKPSLQKVKRLIKKGAFWNAGMFCFKKELFLKELKTHDRKVFSFYEQPFKRLTKVFHKVPAISVDYAIMQKTKRAAVVEFLPKWSDLGSWDSFLEFFLRKTKSNLSVGDGEFLDSVGCFSFSEN